MLWALAGNFQIRHFIFRHAILKVSFFLSFNFHSSQPYTCAYNMFYVDYQVLYSHKRETHFFIHDFFDKNHTLYYLYFYHIDHMIWNYPNVFHVW